MGGRSAGRERAMTVPHFDSRMIGRRIANRATPRRTIALVAGLVAVAGCGAGDPQGLVTPTTMTVAPGQAQDGVVNQPVAIPPAVEVRGEGGRPAAGVTVVFRVTSGGGVVLGDTVMTNGQGAGQVGGWILGSSEGPNTLVAEVAGLDPVTFSATALLSLFRIEVRVVAGNPTTPVSGTCSAGRPAGGERSSPATCPTWCSISRRRGATRPSTRRSTTC